VIEFVAALEKAGANHEAMKASITLYKLHIEQLQSQPLCLVSNHRSLAEELEAKTFQLHAQYTTGAEWQLRRQQLQSVRDTGRQQRASRDAAREG
jgi:hypothetical protein